MALATQDFIPVAIDSRHLAHRPDAEGKFFQKLGWGSVNTLCVATANGKTFELSSKWNFPEGLEKWRQLPRAERGPGVKLEDLGKYDPAYNLTPPPGGLIANVYIRRLAQNPQGQWYTPPMLGVESDDPQFPKLHAEPNRDHLWLTKAEWQALVPVGLKKGDTVAVPAPIVERIFRFYLLDRSICEGSPWERKEVLAGGLRLTVEEASPAAVRLRLQGSAQLGKNPKEALRFQILGLLDYDAQQKAFRRFDLVALSDDGLGVAFELARGETPVDRLAPYSLSYEGRLNESYFGTKKYK